MELTLGNLLNEGDVNHEDFIARIEVINSCGYGVLVSNYFEYFKLSPPTFAVMFATLSVWLWD